MIRGDSGMWLSRLEDKVPLVVKVATILGAIALLTWFAQEILQKARTREFASLHLGKLLESEAMTLRWHINEELLSRERWARLLVGQASFGEYVAKHTVDWNQPSAPVDYDALHPPPWLPPPSLLRVLPFSSFLLLLDGSGRVRERFHPRGVGNHLEDVPSWQSLMPLPVNDVGQRVILYEKHPILLSIANLAGTNAPRAFIVIVTLLDQEFLTSMRREFPGLEGITVLQERDSGRVIAGSGTDWQTITTENIHSDYLVREISLLFDMGVQSEINLAVLHLFPRMLGQTLSERLISSSRPHHWLSLGILLIAFVLLLVWITRKLDGVIDRVEAAARDMLGTVPNLRPSRDRLRHLEAMSEYFISELKQAWIRQEEELEARKRTELELEQHRNQLEKILEEMVVSRTRELQRSKERLEREIDDRNQAYAAQARLAAAIEQSREIVVITDPRGLVQYVNPAFETTMVLFREEVLGADIRVLKSGAHPPSYYDGMGKVLRKGGTWRGRFSHRNRQGQTLELEATVTPVKGSEDEVIHYAAVARDVTRELAMERSLRQSQKLEAVGTLAGGIAHDFNNILVGILSYTELSLDDVPAESQTAQNLNEVILACLRARELIKGLMTFSRREDQVGFRQPTLLAPILREVVALIRVGASPRIQTRLVVEDEVSLVLADGGKIHQVLMNLCTNALHAMSAEGGTLVVTLKKVGITDPVVVGVPTLRNGDYLVIMVEDSGMGILPEHLEHIFEPFFTTKEVGQGTGLGLSISHGIIQNHEGEIQVTSEVGKGTRFRIFLPILETLSAGEPQPG